MRAHHYLGYLPKIGETLWYVATWREQWLALLSFSGSALKCAVRDRWIGWTLRQHYGRLKLVVNNSRFLILPDGHFLDRKSTRLNSSHEWISYAVFCLKKKKKNKKKITKEINYK